MTTTPLDRGDRVANFVLADAAGAYRVFYDLTRGGPGAVLLLRAADPLAPSLIASFVAMHEAMIARSLEPFAVVTGPADQVVRLQRETKAAFPVLADVEG